MRIDTIRERVTSVLSKHPFQFVQSETPFDFDLQPNGLLDRAFRIESDGGEVIGGFNYSEERDDILSIWVARKHAARPEATYQTLVTDASSIRAAVIRDGAQDSGEYHVPDDGAGMSIERDPAQNYAVMRVTVPVNYMTTS